MKLSNNALLVTMFFLCSHVLYAQCPGCEIDLPQLPADTIFLSDAPDGKAGVYYNEDFSFRMPKTTDPVNALDPSIPGGLTLDEVKILAVVNLPPGLNWEGDQTTFNPADETDGCVKLCGTPLQPGHYEMVIVLEAKIAIVSQTASYSHSIYIAPGSSTTDGFTMSNNQGCGAVEVSFENNVPSNGETGFTYVWDFGNGFNSSLENPGNQVYDEPGMYVVSYQAAVDTITPTLASVTLFDVDCDDIIGDADVYIRIKNPEGETIYSTSPINNTPLPITIAVNIPMEAGTYKLEVRDDDPFGTADCGNILFNFSTIDTLTDGDLEASFDILKPVFTTTSTDTVWVFEQPNAPTLNVNGSLELCSNNPIDLQVTNYLGNIQWYRDTILLFGDTLPSYTANQSASYWAEYTGSNGCVAQSEMVELSFIPAPPVPLFENNDNWLTMTSPTDITPDQTVQWYLEGELIDGANEIDLCIQESGNYTLELIDLVTGCSNSFTLSMGYDPDMPCFDATNELPDALSEFIIFPNPTNGVFTISLDLLERKDISFEIFDLTGKTILTEYSNSVSGRFEKQLDIFDLTEGIYLLRLNIDNQSVTRRIVKM